MQLVCFPPNTKIQCLYFGMVVFAVVARAYFNSSRIEPLHLTARHCVCDLLINNHASGDSF